MSEAQTGPILNKKISKNFLYSISSYYETKFRDGHRPDVIFHSTLFYLNLTMENWEIVRISIFIGKILTKLKREILIELPKISKALLSLFGKPWLRPVWTQEITMLKIGLRTNDFGGKKMHLTFVKPKINKLRNNLIRLFNLEIFCHGSIFRFGL